ncbi:type II toxin-antitoxin system RelE/ParE family toxin [Nevskia sp.]|uniref:type II toxin-antitoxin system RelE/ParE family toxin n=1 Tax=Nevskia sp. TaxID=1929292 RepID=UPI0025D7608B|nr:type II toxin-antitoxin system RelE/ParE family toxin [Nevskia sp.]
MRYAVVVSDGAAQDLADLHRYIATGDGHVRADQVIDGIAARLAALAAFPNGGEHPPELLALGIRRYRQVHQKPWRMIYRVDDIEQRVLVLVVGDGRRDFQTLLRRRLIGD